MLGAVLTFPYLGERIGVPAKAGYKALYGNILQANHEMLDLAQHLGFTQESGHGADVTVVSRLA